MAKSAQITISEFWPHHVEHKTVGKHPEWDEKLGVVCACGEVLGWPVEEPPEIDDEPEPEPIVPDMSTVEGRRAAMAAAKEKVESARRRADAQAEQREERGEAPADDYGHKADVITGAFGRYPRTVQPVRDVSLPDDPATEIRQMMAETTGAVVRDELKRMNSMPVARGAVEYHPPAIEDGDVWGDGDEAQALPGWAPGERTDEQEQADGSQEEYTGQAVVDFKAIMASMCDGKIYDPPLGPEPCDTPPEDGHLMCEMHEELGPMVSTDQADEWDQRNGIVKHAISAAPVATDEPEPLGDVVPFAGTPIFPTEAQDLDPLTNTLAPLDPTIDYTPADVELKIVAILNQLERSEKFLRQQMARLHQATHNRDFRYNLAISQSNAKAADQRKADAWLATKDDQKEVTEAEALVRALRDAQHNLRSMLSGFQSVARSISVSLTNSLDGRDMPRPTTNRPPEPPPVAPWEYQ